MPRWTTVFDLDDTLVSERCYARSGLRHVGRWLASEHGLEDLGERLVAAMESGRRHDIFDVVFEPAGVPRSLIGDAVAAYRGHRPELELYADVLDALTRARELGPVAIITDGPAITQRQKLAAVADDLAARVDLIVVTDEAGHNAWKPSGYAYERVQAELGSPGERCCYVGDNPEKDFLWPRAHGWFTVRIDRPDRYYTRSAPSPAHAAHAAIESLIELSCHWPPQSRAP